MVNIRIKKSRQSAKVTVCSARRFREGMMVMKVGSFRYTEVGGGAFMGGSSASRCVGVKMSIVPLGNG